MTRFYELFQWESGQRDSKMVCDEIHEGCFAFWCETVNDLEVMAELQYRESLFESAQHRDIMG